MEISAASGLPSTLLDALKRNAAAQRSGAQVGGVGGGMGMAPAAQGPSFTNAFDQALRSVSATQNEAARMAEDFQINPAAVSLEQTMIASQKSQIAFQSALHVRNKLISAYSDIMNMQV